MGTWRATRRGLRLAAIGLGAAGIGFAAFAIEITRLTSIELLRPKRWRLDEGWPGVPFATGPVRSGDLPAATYADADGLVVVGPRHGTADGPVPLHPLRVGDRIVAVDGVSTRPPSPPLLAAAFHGRPAGTTVRLDVERSVGPSVHRRFVAMARPPVALDPGDLGLPFREILLTAPDGRRLRGWHIPAPKTPIPAPALIYLHGRQTNRRSVGLTELAERAHRAGYHLVLCDLFGSGESDGEIDFWGTEEVRLGLDYLRTQPSVDPARIGVIGLSFGGYKALLALGALGDRIGATVLVTAAGAAPAYIRLVAPPDRLPPFLRRRLLAGLIVPRWLMAITRPLIDRWVDWRCGDGRRFAEYEPTRAAVAARGPVLLIHGTADATFRPAYARAVYAALPGPKELFWLDGMDHFNAVHAGDLLWERVFAFLARWLALNQATNGLDSPDLNRGNGADRTALLTATTPEQAAEQGRAEVGDAAKPVRTA
ncbi:MAG: hypothetical protein AVDCRST_MAG73-461 [uncultured Thermomicrobiales bacterium]|uniref:PDZ domain-containing protein n=1 Tax=uncultured Thermomicrobiales bacterium TaxID=1645740 RepID=A0A6J4TJD9_9BACT|nr:MAG: hypothetical protein AVDCRST_MAG73-461 [uncultured Thermomicrobiales bacterium]